MDTPRQELTDAEWEALASRRWRRRRWRRKDGEPLAVCAAFGTPLHREGTYYVRPAYTDGQLWLCQQAYDELIRRTSGQRASRRSGARPEGP